MHILHITHTADLVITAKYIKTISKLGFQNNYAKPQLKFTNHCLMSAIIYKSYTNLLVFNHMYVACTQCRA